MSGISKTPRYLVAIALLAAGCDSPGGTSTFPDAGVIRPVEVDSGLPEVATLPNVVAAVDDDTVRITFHPVDGARDYRVYELADPSRLHVFADGSIAIDDATYRCGGDRELNAIPTDGEEDTLGMWAHSSVEGNVEGYTRTLADATLGYVFYAPGENRVPVYALGDPSSHADNSCGSGRWGASRGKIYTASETERESLLGMGWRDDGVAFYAPTSGEQVMHAHEGAPSVMHYYYLASSGEAGERSSASPEPAFFVSATPLPESDALMRVRYSTCVYDFTYPSHDEFAVGQTLFERLRHQGADQPMTSLTWSGLTGPTTLVIEALATGCPYQGRLGPTHIAERTEDYPGGPYMHTPTFTIEELRAQAEYGEVYINGQHDTTQAPVPIARSFIQVEPGEHVAMDWFEDFSPTDTMAPFEYRMCSVDTGNCFQQFEATSSDYSLLWHTIETDSYGIAPVMGELWVQFTDWAADTNGKYRLEPHQRGNVASDTYFHSTMESTVVSTSRRYPQMMISDQPSPLQYYMTQGNTIVLQPRWWTPSIQLQVCDHQFWDVNNQCPGFVLNQYIDVDHNPTGYPPAPDVVEEIGVDRRTQFDIYLSTRRAYVFLNERPFGCVDLPAAGVPSGEVSVAYGSVLYHSEVDTPLGFHARHYDRSTGVHFDNLGFSSGVPAPAWDETRFPCISADQMLESERL